MILIYHKSNNVTACPLAIAVLGMRDAGGDEDAGGEEDGGELDA
jgi:hypothetical protein